MLNSKLLEINDGKATTINAVKGWLNTLNKKFGFKLLEFTNPGFTHACKPLRIQLESLLVNDFLEM